MDLLPFSKADSCTFSALALCGEQMEKNNVAFVIPSNKMWEQIICTCFVAWQSHNFKLRFFSITRKDKKTSRLWNVITKPVACIQHKYYIYYYISYYQKQNFQKGGGIRNS